MDKWGWLAWGILWIGFIADSHFWFKRQKKLGDDIEKLKQKYLEMLRK